jgi:uncharacterized membrane protein
MNRWVQRAAVAALVVFAVFVRADSLSEPNYWYDEAITSLRVAGHTEREVAEFAEAHPTFPFERLRRFVEVNSETSTADTIRSVAEEDPQHTPLYYIAARAWARLLGSSVEVGRSFAALMSVLALAAMYWLCWELFVKTGAFESPAVCWLGVLAMALSPYQVAIAREHREYSMWVLLSTIVCAAFLRALRVDNAKAWIFYGVAIAASLYTHLVSALAVGALGAFLLIRERFRFSGAVWRFCAASTAAGLTCLPWLFVLLAGRGTAESSLGWVQQLSRGRFQLQFSLDPVIRTTDLSIWHLQRLIEELPGYRFTLPMTQIVPVVTLLALWYVARGPRRVCAGLATALIVSVSGTIFALDFFTGSATGWAYRYGVPTSLGWLLAVTMLLAAAVTWLKPWPGAGPLVVGAYVLIAATSAVMTHDAKHTWAKAWDQTEEISEYLNSRGKLSLVSDDFVGAILALRHQVRDDLPLSWNARCYSCPRVLQTPLEIPFRGEGETLYFRSWVNTPRSVRPQAERMAADKLDDPRFHTRHVQLSKPQPSLFLLTPR